MFNLTQNFENARMQCEISNRGYTQSKQISSVLEIQYSSSWYIGGGGWIRHPISCPHGFVLEDKWRHKTLSGKFLVRSLQGRCLYEYAIRGFNKCPAALIHVRTVTYFGIWAERKKDLITSKRESWKGKLKPKSWLGNLGEMSKKEQDEDESDVKCPWTEIDVAYGCQTRTQGDTPKTSIYLFFFHIF